MDEHCKCTSIVRVSKVQVEENGKKATFLNPNKVKHAKVSVDGCLVEQALACDWIIEKEGVGSVLLELKGTDVTHALEQLRATLEFAKASGKAPAPYGALVVCSSGKRHPSVDTKIQKAKNAFATQFRTALHVVSGTYEYEFENVLSFVGPFKR